MNFWPVLWGRSTNAKTRRIPASIMPTFSLERQPLPVSELAGLTGKAKGADEGEAAAEVEGAAEVEEGDEGKSPANANGPTLGVPAWIIQTDAHLQPETLNVNSV